MSGTLDELMNEFCDYAQDILKLPVFKGKRPMTPQMINPFAVISYSEIEQVPFDLIDLVGLDTDDDELIENMRGLFRVTFLIQTFGGQEAIEKLKRLKMSFSSDSFVLWCSIHGWGTSGSDNVEDISAVLLDSNYEKRAQLSASFYVNSPESFDVEYFNKQKLTTKAKDMEIETWVLPRGQNAD